MVYQNLKIKMKLVNTKKKNWNYIWEKSVCNSQKSVYNHFTYGFT